MHVSFTGSFPKTQDYPDANEDCFVITDDQLCIALCDGASESFDSKTWARSLADRFVANPLVDTNWVQEAVDSYRSQYDWNALSWSKQAAFDRGSFATLLGVEVNVAERLINVFAVGDSIALLIEGRTLIDSWPYHTSDQFSQRPLLLSTVSAFNQFVAESDFRIKHSIQWHLGTRNDTVLLCMTDALGEWALRMIQQQDSSWEQLLSLETEQELSDLVQSERSAKRMRTDDSTLIVMNSNNWTHK